MTRKKTEINYAVDCKPKPVNQEMTLAEQLQQKLNGLKKVD